MSEGLRVWIDQKLRTGDRLCTLLTEPGAQADVPGRWRLDIVSAADECPGNWIHVVRSNDGVEVAGPAAI
jgi:ferredoxin